MIRIWDAEKDSCDTIHTSGLTHSVCGCDSGLSRAFSSGRCVAAAAAPRMIELRITECHGLGIDLPRRFGCRSDITDRDHVHRRAEQSLRLYESVRVFQYGGVFVTSISQKILTYSEEGMVSVWSLHS
jgi:hypothetical protein